MYNVHFSVMPFLYEKNRNSCIAKAQNEKKKSVNIELLAGTCYTVNKQKAYLKKKKKMQRRGVGKWNEKLKSNRL